MCKSSWRGGGKEGREERRRERKGKEGRKEKGRKEKERIGEDGETLEPSSIAGANVKLLWRLV